MQNRSTALQCALLLLTSSAGIMLSSCGTETVSADSEALDPAKCGTFIGVVQKQLNGDIISGVEVTAENIKTEQTYSTRTNLNGKYELMVPAGTYTLRYIANGYYGLSTDEYKLKKGEYLESDEPIQLIKIGDNPNSNDNVGPVIEESSSAIVSEPPAESNVTLDPSIVYDDCGDAYSAYINNIFTNLEYRGFDGNTTAGYANMIDYVRYDMNRDGVDELIVNSGSSEADRVISFYTIRDNTVQLIGYNFSGFHVMNYVSDQDSGQFATEWAHQGYGGATWYLYNGDSIQITKESGPTAYSDTETPHFIENCTPLNVKSGRLKDSEWVFD